MYKLFIVSRVVFDSFRE